MKNFGKGVVLGYIGLALHYIFNFLLVPLMIAGFGDSEYGVYKIVTAVSSYFMLADGGLSNTTTKFITEYRIENDEKKKKNFCFIVFGYYICISIVLAVITEGLVFYMPYIYEKSLDVNEIILAQKMIMPLAFTCIVKLFTSLFRGYIKAYERFDISKWGEIFQNILRFLGIYYAIIYGKGAWGAVCVDLVISTLLLLYYLAYSILKLKFKMSYRGITKKRIRGVFNYSGLILLEVIAFQIVWTIDTIVLGIFTSSVTVTIYSIAVTINSYFQSISNVTGEFLMPSVVKAVKEKKNILEITNNMIMYGRYKLMLLLLMIIGLITLGKNFILLWVGDDCREAYYLLIILIVPQLFTQVLDYAGNLMWAYEKQKQRAIIMILVAGVNIVCTIIGVKYWGIYGAAISTAVSVLSGQGFVSVIYYHKILNLDMLRFYREIFQRLGVCILVTVLIGFGIAQIPALSWLIFLVQMFVVIAIYSLLIWTLALNEQEKRGIVDKLCVLVRK